MLGLSPYAGKKSPMKKAPIIAIICLLGVVVVLLFPEISNRLTLEGLKDTKNSLGLRVIESPVLSALIYIGIYICVTAASIPGAIILTLAGGALFGVIWGTLLVSIASTCGATLAFLVVRTTCREFVQNKFNNTWNKVSNGFEKSGPFYLFSLRLVPVVPFFLVNVLMALTNIRIRDFFFISQIGMLPATIVYVFAGTELSRITTVKDIVSPGMLAAFILIACLPWAARFLLTRLKRNDN